MTDKQKKALESVGYAENYFHSYFLKTKTIAIGSIFREAVAFVDERSGGIRLDGDPELREELKKETKDILKEENV